MRRRQLDARARRDWGDLRLDLDQLARYYKVSWRSDAWVNSQRAGQGGYAANRLTGAYRLDQARSDNPATVADRMSRGLPGGEQQRRHNVILRSLLAKSLSAKFWNEALEVTMIRLIHKVMGQDVGNA